MPVPDPILFSETLRLYTCGINACAACFGSVAIYRICIKQYICSKVESEARRSFSFEERLLTAHSDRRELWVDSEITMELVRATDEFNRPKGSGIF